MKFRKITSATVCTLLFTGTAAHGKIRAPLGKDDVAVMEKESFKTEQSFVFDGLKHTLTSDDVDGSLCDMNSKSMSGYMDVSGSRYDRNGEGKHLFYWFFEKRTKSLIPSDDDPNTANKNNEEEVMEESSIPLIVWLTGVS